MKNEEGDFMVYDREEKRPLPQFTNKLLHDNLIFEDSQMDQFEKKLVQVKVNSIDDLCVWLEKYDKKTSEVDVAEERLSIAKNNLHMMLKEDTYMYPNVHRITYAETKAMGCTDVVYWNDEPQTNPKTGNEFFTPEDAKEKFETLKTEQAEEIEDELDDAWTASHYIWKDAAWLDDLVYEEENGLPQSK